MHTSENVWIRIWILVIADSVVFVIEIPMMISDKNTISHDTSNYSPDPNIFRTRLITHTVGGSYLTKRSTLHPPFRHSQYQRSDFALLRTLHRPLTSTLFELRSMEVSDVLT